MQKVGKNTKLTWKLNSLPLSEQIFFKRKLTKNYLVFQWFFNKFIIFNITIKKLS